MPDQNQHRPRKWGGDRPRAGRPRSKNPRVSLTIQIPAILKDALRREAEAENISLSRAAENRLKR